MANKPNIYIGIDPDTAKSGVAIWSKQNKFLELSNMKFFDLFAQLLFMRRLYNEEVLVIVDAGWLNKSNFHASNKFNKSVNSIIGERTGANHEVGKKIVEMCEYLGLKYELHKPTKSKVNAETFAKITGVKGRTNQEQRDAGLLVYGK